MRDGEMVPVTIDYSPVRGDSTVSGQPFREAFPISADYLEGRAWYRPGAQLLINGLYYGPFEDVVLIAPPIRVGTYRGIAVYRPASPGRSWIYLPLRPGCVFRAYLGQDIGTRR